MRQIKDKQMDSCVYRRCEQGQSHRLKNQCTPANFGVVVVNIHLTPESWLEDSSFTLIKHISFFDTSV